MGSACNCGGNSGFSGASWQGNSGSSLNLGKGYYSGAVNQKLFSGSLNDKNQPGCGKTCGSCYELQSTGTNAYDNGPNGGSSIVVMVADACYNQDGKPNWCSSSTAEGQDDFGCSAHFDIQTSGPSKDNGPAAVGTDGQPWTSEFLLFPPNALN